MEKLGDIVVRFDLDRISVPAKSQGTDKVFRKIGPVNIGIGDRMSIVIADCAVDFTHQFNRFELIFLAQHARDYIGELFAGRGWAG